MITCCRDTPLPDFRSPAPQNLRTVAAMLAREKFGLAFEVSALLRLCYTRRFVTVVVVGWCAAVVGRRVME